MAHMREKKSECARVHTGWKNTEHEEINCTTRTNAFDSRVRYVLYEGPEIYAVRTSNCTCAEGVALPKIQNFTLHRTIPSFHRWSTILYAKARWLILFFFNDKIMARICHHAKGSFWQNRLFCSFVLRCEFAKSPCLWYYTLHVYYNSTRFTLYTLLGLASIYLYLCRLTDRLQRGRRANADLHTRLTRARKAVCNSGLSPRYIV